MAPRLSSSSATRNSWRIRYILFFFFTLITCARSFTLVTGRSFTFVTGPRRSYGAEAFFFLRNKEIMEDKVLLYTRYRS